MDGQTNEKQHVLIFLEEETGEMLGFLPRNFSQGGSKGAPENRGVAIEKPWWAGGLAMHFR